MPEEYAQPEVQNEGTTRLRDLEEKQRLLKDRILLIGKSLIDERDKNFAEMQEMKKSIIILKEETARIKELLERITEQLTTTARKEELLILQHQFDLFRKV